MDGLGVLRPTVPLDLRRSRSNWLLDRIREEARAPDTAAELAVEGLTVVLLGELQRAGSRSGEGVRPGWLIRALEMLHESPDDPPSLSALASQVGVHPGHLSRTFSRFHGCSMGEYLRRLRVERAARDLRGTDRPIAAIALDAGFADQAHFTRTFKRLMGETPGRYRSTS
jgi:AraC family transcriptional regulator